MVKSQNVYIFNITRKKTVNLQIKKDRIKGVQSEYPWKRHFVTAVSTFLHPLTAQLRKPSTY